MDRRKRRNRDAARHEKVFAFRQCPGCSFDFLTGEGTRSCSWYECPYLPEDLKVFCPECNYNFATGDGVRRCSDPATCEWANEGFRHAKTLQEYLKRTTAV